MKKLLLLALLIGGLTASAEDARLPLDQPTPAATPAASLAQPHLAPLNPPPPPYSANTQLGLYLLLLMGLAAGGIYFLRNGFAAFLPQAKGVRKLHITETRGLGNRQFLIVAEYESRKILLGVCPGRIDFLCNLSNPETEFPEIQPEDYPAQNTPPPQSQRTGEDPRHV